jgi:hypothetical protein
MDLIAPRSPPPVRLQVKLLTERFPFQHVYETGHSRICLGTLHMLDR